MKDLISFATSSNSNLFAVVVVLLLAIIFASSVIKKFYTLSAVNKLQKNSLSFSTEHIGCYFKILKIKKEKEIVQLGYNPTVEHPFGVGVGWFKIDKIPEELRKEYAVILLEKGPNDELIFTKGPIF